MKQPRVRGLHALWQVMRATKFRACTPGWTEENPWNYSLIFVLQDDCFWGEQVHQPAIAWLVYGGRGVPLTPAEQVCMAHVPGLGTVTAELEGKGGKRAKRKRTPHKRVKDRCAPNSTPAKETKGTGRGKDLEEESARGFSSTGAHQCQALASLGGESGWREHCLGLTCKSPRVPFSPPWREPVRARDCFSHGAHREGERGQGPEEACGFEAVGGRSCRRASRLAATTTRHRPLARLSPFSGWYLRWSTRKAY